jgi:small-conductance mechanosensitive channel
MVVASVIGGFIRHYSGDGKSGVLSTSIFAIIARIIIITIGIMIILQSLDISITPMLTALGVGGLAVALALQDTLSNLFSGFHLLLTGKVRVGDWIELSSGEAGHVIDITWRNTTIKQRRNNIIIIPNSTVASSITTNYNLPQAEMAIRVECGVAYSSDLEHVEKVTVEVAADIMKNVEGAVPSHKPFVRFSAFGDSSINFYVNLRVENYGKQFRVRHEFIKKLHKRFNEEGIVIPFPIRTLDIPKNSKLIVNKGD